MNSDTFASTYAASSGAAAFLLIFGIVVVAVLISAFIFGPRLRARELPPPRPEEQPTRPPAEVRRRQAAELSEDHKGTDGNTFRDSVTGPESAE